MMVELVKENIKADKNSEFFIALCQKNVQSYVTIGTTAVMKNLCSNKLVLIIRLMHLIINSILSFCIIYYYLQWSNELLAEQRMHHLFFIILALGNPY